MMINKISEYKVSTSMKWSSLSEIISKLIGPITISVLSRVLVPEDFAVIATISMCISFINIFTDSGFSKYIILFDYKDIEEEAEVFNVAFWSNLFISIVVYIFICIFSKEIADYLFGSKNVLVIYIAFFNIIITSFSSVQSAILKKDLNFRSYFFVRIGYTLVPLLVTVPLALIYKNFWAMIIGIVMNELINAIILTVFSRWRPSFQYKLKILRKIFNYSFWSLLEGILFWTIVWADTFVVKIMFSSYQLGLFKNSSNLIISIMSIIGVTVTTVVFTSLTKLKNNLVEFKKLYNLLLKILSYIVFPMSTGIVLFSKEIVLIILGPKWLEASIIFSLIAIMYGLNIVFILFNNEVFKAKGLPKILFILNFLQLILIILFSVYGSKYGFTIFLYFRTIVIIPQILIMFLFLRIFLQFRILNFLKIIINPLISSFFMVVVGIYLKKLIPFSGISSVFTMLLTGINYILFIFIVFRKDFYTIKDFLLNKEEKC